VVTVSKRRVTQVTLTRQVRASDETEH
jgi:hypothetical protein